MAQSLSTAALSEIERVTKLCQQLEFFAPKQIVGVTALSHGASNQSYCVKTAQGDYVLRCYPEQHMVCRQQELRCQHAAAAKGLSPLPLCLNNHYQVMISEYIANAEPYDYHKHGANALIESVATFHQLSVQTNQLDYPRYLSSLAGAVAFSQGTEKALFLQVENVAKTLSLQSQDNVLCHLDLHQGNLLFANDALWLLDFEYAQQADSSLDLAAIIIHFKLDAKAQEHLLKRYISLRNTDNLADVLAKNLVLAKVLYCAFCWLWYLSIAHCQSQAAYWQHETARYLAML